MDTGIYILAFVGALSTIGVIGFLVLAMIVAREA